MTEERNEAQAQAQADSAAASDLQNKLESSQARVAELEAENAELRDPGGDDPATTQPTPPQEFELQLQAFTFYDIDDRAATTDANSDTDLSVGNGVNNLGNTAGVGFNGEGRIVDSWSATAEDCDTSTRIFQGSANIYGDGDGPVLCIRTTEDVRYLVRHVPVNVPGGGITLELRRL